MRIPVVRPAVAAALSLLAATPALLAQQEPPPNPNPTPPAGGPPAEQQPAPGRQRVVVSASGFREAELDTPYTFQQLDQRDLVERGFRTLPESLAMVPGVMVQKTTHGHGSPFIRGFTGRQNLILIDGVRFNNSAFRGGPVQYWNTIDAFAIDRLEVVKSQGSVLYGSDAIGGTVNLLTKSSRFRDHAPDAAFCTGSAFYRFDTNGGSHTGRLENAVGEGDRFGLFAGVTYRDFGDIRDRVLGTMEKTGYEEFDFDLRFDWAVGPKATLTAVHQRVTQDDVWRTHNTIFFESWQGTTLPTPDLARIYDQERDLSYLRLAGSELGGGAVDEYSLTLSYQNSTEDFNRTRLRSGNTQVQLDRTTVATLGAALSLESRIGEGRIVYGLDWYSDDVDSRTHVLTFAPSGALLSDVRSVQGPLGDDAFYDLAGAFVQGRVPAGSDWEFTAGARYTYAKARIGQLDDGAGAPIKAKRDWDQLTLNLRANVALTDEWHAYGGASQAFRAPNIDDLSSLKSSRTGVISTGSLDIDPENYLTYEVGTRWLTGDFGLQAAAFWTDIRDLITSRPIGTDPGTGEVITTTTNGADGFLWGGELQAEWQLDREWRASGFVAYVDGEADAFPTASLTPVEEPISRLMPLTGSTALRWTGPQNGLWVEGRVIAAAHAGRLSSGDRADTSRFPPDGTPSYVVANLSTGWQVDEHLELLLTLENLTDTSYRTHGSGVNQPGFNAILGGRLSW
ncbi:MAG: TonB-dependent receptor [Planctomycetes bacterium]|nr:TonB-dependent receptor [Planctomycetota bacterium]